MLGLPVAGLNIVFGRIWACSVCDLFQEDVMSLCLWKMLKLAVADCEVWLTLLRRRVPSLEVVEIWWCGCLCVGWSILKMSEYGVPGTSGS